MRAPTSALLQCTKRPQRFAALAAAIRCGQGLPENLRTNALRKSLGFCPLKGIHSKGDPRAVKAQGFAIRAALEREGRKEGRPH